MVKKRLDRGHSERKDVFRSGETTLDAPSRMDFAKGLIKDYCNVSAYCFTLEAEELLEVTARRNAVFYVSFPCGKPTLPLCADNEPLHVKLTERIAAYFADVRLSHEARIRNSVSGMFSGGFLPRLLNSPLTTAAVLTLILLAADFGNTPSAPEKATAEPLPPPVAVVFMPEPIPVKNAADLTDGYGVFADGIFAGAVADKSAVEEVLSEKIETYSEKPNIIDVGFDKTVTYAPGLYYEDSLVDADELVEELIEDGLIQFEYTRVVRLTQSIPFETEKVETAKRAGERVVQEGVEGEEEHVYLLHYSNGEIISREHTETNVVKEPVTKEIEVGVLQPGLTPEAIAELKQPEDGSKSWLIWPVNGGRFSSGFGYRSSGMHYGLDIMAPNGTAIYAAADGVVTFAGWDGGYGKCIRIDHGGGWTTLYAHEQTIAVSVGEEVVTGQFIGTVGETGNSRGSHLHFEVRYGGKALDPMGQIIINR